MLNAIYNDFGDKPTPEFGLQFAPRRIVEKAIRMEMMNYKSVNAYEKIDIDDIPTGVKIISSHHFLQFKHDGETGKLKLRCKLVSHGKHNKEEFEVWAGSSTEQFPFIRVVFSLASIFKFILSLHNIKSAYILDENLPLDIYGRLPRRRSSSLRIT